METVHGPKLASLVGELLQPLDLGKKKEFLFSRCISLTMPYMPGQLFRDLLRELISLQGP